MHAHFAALVGEVGQHGEADQVVLAGEAQRGGADAGGLGDVDAAVAQLDQGIAAAGAQGAEFVFVHLPKFDVAGAAAAHVGALAGVAEDARGDVAVAHVFTQTGAAAVAQAGEGVFGEKGEFGRAQFRVGGADAGDQPVEHGLCLPGDFEGDAETLAEVDRGLVKMDVIHRLALFAAAPVEEDGFQRGDAG